MGMKNWILAVSALSLLTLASAAPSAAAGKKLFDGSCAGCHGAKAQGGIGPSLKDAGTWKPELFKRALKQGKDDKGVQLKAMMPKFPQLTDKQILDIQTFIKSSAKK